MRIKKIINEFILTVLSSETVLEDKYLITELEKKGYSKEESFYVTMLTPVVFARIIGESLDVKFSNEYYEHLDGNIVKMGILQENVYFNEIYRLANGFFQAEIMTEESVLKIAFRSPEFKLLNEFMLKGNNAEDVRFSPLHFSW